jgi:Zn finger protein HypA/HybF involved in hydrogenase expression
LNRAQRITKIFADLNLSKDQRYLQCESCGYITTMPSGTYGTDALGDTTRAPLMGEEDQTTCPKCGKPMSEVFRTSATVMGSHLQTPRGGTAPGGGLHGGAYH